MVKTDHQYQSVEEMVVLNLFAFDPVHTRSELTISEYQSVGETVAVNLFAFHPVHTWSELTIRICRRNVCSKFVCLPSSTHLVRTDHQYQSVEETVLNLFAFHPVHTWSELTITEYQSVEEMFVLSLFACHPIHTWSELTISISLSKRQF